MTELCRARVPTTPNVIERSRQYAIVDDTWHYVVKPATKPELYGYRSDAGETVNHADSAAGPPIVTAMQQRLMDEICRDTLTTRVASRRQTH